MANPLTNRKFIHFNNLANFENIINNLPGAILDSQIVFIKDARKIWTHGTYYTLDERITNDIYARLQELAEISADIIQRLEVPVLSAAPTTSTSTYDNGAKTFVVDQSCKVADANGYYTYYRLHSIVNNTYNWKKEENLSSEQILNIVKYGTDKEVVEANGVSQFPATGEAGVVYIDTSTTPSTPYKWQNGAYVLDSTLIDNSDKQANWAETDSNSNQYIQNKPTVITEQAILDLFGGSSVDPSQNPNVITSNDVVNTTKNGIVPKTTAAVKYLQTNAQGVPSWGDLPTIPATQSAAGLMSAADKIKADNTLVLDNSATTTGSLTLSPNTLYSLGALTGALTVTLDTPVSGIQNTYMMEFDVDDSAATPTKVPSFPAAIVWKEEPVWTTGKHYEISIRYSANTQAYYAMFAEFDTYVAS